jgi:hypothetical protein
MSPLASRWSTIRLPNQLLGCPGAMGLCQASAFGPGHAIWPVLNVPCAA